MKRNAVDVFDQVLIIYCVCHSGPDGVAEENFFAPTVIADVDDSMLCMREESFAPLFSVSTFDREQDAIAIANNTEVIHISQLSQYQNRLLIIILCKQKLVIS